MGFRRLHRPESKINAGTMADIGFLLLIFFLVTSSMQSRKNIPINLPPNNNEATVISEPIDERNLLEIKLDNDIVLIKNQQMPWDSIPSIIESFVANPTKSNQNAENSNKALITITATDKTPYQQYIRLYDSLRSGYIRVYVVKSLEIFNQSYSALPSALKDSLYKQIPMRVAEE